MNDVYTMKIAGLERHLPLCPVNKNLDIAAFVMFSDVELTIACASELIKKHRRLMLLSLPNRRAFRLHMKWQDNLESNILLRGNLPSFI